jgi:hypothetical protein
MNRCLGALLIVAYLALGLSVLPDLLPHFAVAIVTGSKAR